ncbi:Glycosyltransferase AglE [uncultured archaeon]|nr:Glycosyltransferase AglE [uncultured archaeon]
MKFHDMEPKKDDAEVALFSLLSHLIEGQRVLEIGCGNGDLSSEIAKKGFDVVGVDMCIAGIRQTAGKANNDNVTKEENFLVADGARLAFQDGSFDSVILDGVLDHVSSSSKKLLEEAVRVVRNGGRIIVSVPDGSLIPRPGHLRVFSEDTLESELSQYAEEIEWHTLPLKRWLICSFFVRKSNSYISEGPLIDVIMPTYNGRKSIKRAIKSILSQTYQNWSLIVVNDGGEDVKDILDEFHNNRIKYIITEHKGKAHALNMGIKSSNGKFISYLDDDDILYPIHLEALIKAALRERSDFVYDDWYEVSLDEDGRETRREFEFRQNVTPAMLILQNYINHKCILHSRSLLKETGMYDEELEILIDWDMIRRLSFACEPYHVWCVTSERLRYYRQGSLKNQITSLWERDPSRARKSLERIIKKTIELPATEQQLKEIIERAMSSFSYYHNLEISLILGELRKQLAEREQQINTLTAQFQESSNRVQAMEQAVAERESKITSLTSELQGALNRAQAMEQAVAEHESKITSLTSQLQEALSREQAMEQDEAERDRRVALRTGQLQEADARASALNQEVTQLQQNLKDRDSHIVTLTSQLQEANQHAHAVVHDITEMQRSIVWQMTMRFHNGFVERALPHGTRRRRWYDLGLKSGRLIVNDGHERFWQDFKNYLFGSKLKNQVEITDITNNEQFILTPSEFMPIDRAKIAVVIHVYYVDLFEEICSYLKNIPVKHTLLISISKKEDRAIIAKHIENLPLVEQAEIRIVENRGRDIAPMLIDFAPLIKRFDYICKIHTKKSLFTGTERTEWRQYLYDMLLGSRERVQAIMTIFEADPTVGVIYPEMWEGISYWAYSWLSNKGIASSFLCKLGIRFDPDEYIDFPAGSMFWARKKALEPLLNLGLRLDDFPEEHGQADGELQHAIERSFVLAAQNIGLKYVVIRDRNNHLFSHRSNRNFYQYLSAPFEVRLSNALPAAAVISFDIFDTLLKRPFARPDFVFDFLEEQVSKEFGVKGFHEIRKESENIARARKHYQGDVKISEIYSVFAELARISTATANKLLELEVNTETALLTPRVSLIKLAKEAKDSGKRIILVSDTYLESKYIEHILSEKGIDFYEALYISCEIGKRKDRGDIWEYILECEGVEKNGFLHIGDNEQSDVQVLVDRRFMYPVHVMKPSVLFRQSEIGEILWGVLKPYKGWRENLLYGMIANLYCSDPSPIGFFESKQPLSDPFALGYTVFGPIVFNFLSWLIKASMKDGIKQLKFLSREGYLLSRAFDIIATHPNIKNAGMILPQGTYFLCSRRALIIASMRTEKNIPLLLNRAFQGTLRDFFNKRMNASDMAAIEDRLGAKVLDEDISLPRDYNKIYTNITKVFDILIRQAEDEREPLLQYYTEQGIIGSENVGLVDVGYSGSIQKALVDLLGRPLAGYYFVLEKTASELTTSGSILRAYFGEFIDTDPKKSTLPIYRHSLLMEAVLTSPDGQLVCFRRSPAGPVPVFKESGISQKEYPSIRRIHEGALKFVKDMLDLFGSAALDIEFSKDLVQSCYDLIVTGELKIGNLESVLSVEDDFSGHGEMPVLSWYRDHDS